MKCVPRCKLGAGCIVPDVNRIWSTVHSWKDSTIQYHTEHPWFANKKLAEEFHVYGFDWTPEGVTVYVDGIRVMTHKAAITYPLVQIISFYDNRKAKNGWTGTYDPSVPYPKSFDIYYIRMYKMSCASLLSNRHACRSPKEKLPCAILTDM